MQNVVVDQDNGNLKLSQSLPLIWRRGEVDDRLSIDSIMYDNESLLGNQHWLDEFERTLYDEIPRGGREDVVAMRIELLLSLVGVWMKRQFRPPPSVPVALDETTLAWRSREAPECGEKLLVDLYLVPRFPMPLVLPCEVVEVLRDDENGGWQTVTRLLHLSERTRQGIARAVFTCHRRILRERRALMESENDNEEES